MYNAIKQTMSSDKFRIQEINAGSMADIAFLLLIFFLVTTTLSTDVGILRKLPPMIVSEPTIQHKRNVMQIWVNKENNLMVRGKATDMEDLRSKVKEFIENPNHADNLPEIESLEIKYLGITNTSKKHIISLMSDRGTKYSIYIAVQNEILGAYNELRNELALKKFKRSYNDLDNSRKKSIEMVYPMHISEAEPNIQ